MRLMRLGTATLPRSTRAQSPSSSQILPPRGWPRNQERAGPKPGKGSPETRVGPKPELGQGGMESVQADLETGSREGVRRPGKPWRGQERHRRA